MAIGHRDGGVAQANAVDAEIGASPRNERKRRRANISARLPGRLTSAEAGTIAPDWTAVHVVSAEAEGLPAQDLVSVLSPGRMPVAQAHAFAGRHEAVGVALLRDGNARIDPGIKPARDEGWEQLHHAAFPVWVVAGSRARGSGERAETTADASEPSAGMARSARAATIAIATPTMELEMSVETPVVPVEAVNWVKQVDGKVAISLTAFGSTLGYVFDPAQAEKLMDGLMGALPQQADEAVAIATSPGHPPEGDVETVEVAEFDRPPHAIQFHLRTGPDQGVQIRVSLREAMRWQRRLRAVVALHLQRTRS